MSTNGEADDMEKDAERLLALRRKCTKIQERIIHEVRTSVYTLSLEWWLNELLGRR